MANSKIKSDINVKEEAFGNFMVKIYNEKHCFLHLDLSNEECFYHKLFEYFFNEDKLQRYSENKSCSKFDYKRSDYVDLYLLLQKFIDEENIISLSNMDRDTFLATICEDYEIINDNGIEKIRLEKIGKIGEYIFSNLLFDYFKLECIIPKLQLATNNNMPIYGIDVLFYEPKQKLLFFGESKVTKDLKSGIDQANRTLENYQYLIDNEYKLVLNNRFIKDKLGSFEEDFGEIKAGCKSMSEFINDAKIEKICIPIFIAHGKEIDVYDILCALDQIKKITVYDIDTKFILISLPLINKQRFSKAITNEISRKIAYYENKIQESKSARHT